jgi:hypothetical protein
MSQFFQGTINSGNLPPEVPTSFVTDDGTGIPAAHILNVLGGSGIETYVDPNLSNNLYIKVQNSTTDTNQTIDDEIVTLSTIDCSAPGTYFFTSQISAFTTGGNGLGAQLYTTAISDGSTLTVIDDTDSVGHRTPALSGPGNTINYEIVYSVTNALLRVTGEDNFTIDWGAITIYVYKG